MVMSTVEESGWSVPLAMAEEDMETTSESDSMDDSPPVHPVPTMQGAFEESMAETMNGEDEDKPPDRYSKADSVTRRKMLLEQDQYERTVGGRWKQKPGERFHPLWKLVAQISFGVHLLQQGLAKSDAEVLKILQTHVDEVDGFLERTTEDFDLAQGDIDERIRYLKLPLEHGQVFDQMLGDRDFRVAIVEGNEKIEHIIDRTAAAMNDALKDVQKGLDATRELAKYMTRVDKMWEDRTEEHDSVYLAMIGNTEGWTRAFLTLQSKGGHLRKALVQLGGIVAEMQRRAGAASRKNLLPSRSTNGRYIVDTRSESPQHSATPPRSPNKPLPFAPDPAARIATSQKYIKPPRSANSSPYANQSTTGPKKGGLKRDTGSQPRQNATLSPQSPGLSRSARTPTPDTYARPQDTAHLTKSPKTGLGVSSTTSLNPNQTARVPEPQMSVKSQEISRSVTNPEPQRFLAHTAPPRSLKSSHHESSMKTSEPIREGSPETATPFKTPAQIMARMADASKSTVPERSLSRRRSLTERTRSILGKRSPVHISEGIGNSTADSPLQGFVDDVGSEGQPSPPILRRWSIRQHHYAMSMSAYSASPTTSERPDKPTETPPNREASPQYTRDGRAVPRQSSYGSLSLIPNPPEFSPLQNSFSEKDLEQDIDMSAKPPTPQTTRQLISQAASSPKPNNMPDDSEGSVNNDHPLLREARHARFATRTTPGTPVNKSSRDLPLRHYHSQTQLAHSNPDLTQGKFKNHRPPKRSSSLLYIPSTRYTQPGTNGIQSRARKSPTPEQSTPNSSTLNLLTNTTALPPEQELGIHPAHRTPEPNTTSTTAPSPSPGPSLSSSTTEQGATPPPISTVRSPQSNSPPPGPAPAPPSQSPTPQLNEAQRTEPNPCTNPPKTSENLKPPFYLNPASSSALVDFLASTPPPSPPRPGTRTEPGTPATVSTAGFFNNRAAFSHTNDNASTPPPAPGDEDTAPWQANETTPQDYGRSTTQKKGSGWKRMFGGSKSTKEKSSKGPKKGRSARRKTSSGLDEELGAPGMENVNKRGTEKDKDGGFMGVGKEGVWISRKNFVRN